MHAVAEYGAMILTNHSSHALSFGIISVISNCIILTIIPKGPQIPANHSYKPQQRSQRLQILHLLHTRTSAGTWLGIGLRYTYQVRPELLAPH